MGWGGGGGPPPPPPPPRNFLQAMFIGTHILSGDRVWVLLGDLGQDTGQWFLGIFPWFQDLFLQISLCLKMFFKEEKLPPNLSFLVCGESVNPPKNQHLVGSGTLSSLAIERSPLALPQARASPFLFNICLFATKRCPLAAKIAGSIGIVPCCVSHDLFT